MSQNKCPQCGAPIDMGAGECKFCGEKLVVQNMYQAPPMQQAPTGQQVSMGQSVPPVQGVPQGNAYNSPIDPAWPIKNKLAAGLLGIFLGGLGIHKFYMGRIGLGILYLVFCWTYIPAIVGFIEGVVYLCSNEHNFQVKHRVRLR